MDINAKLDVVNKKLDSVLTALSSLPTGGAVDFQPVLDAISADKAEIQKIESSLGTDSSTSGSTTGTGASTGGASA